MFVFITNLPARNAKIGVKEFLPGFFSLFEKEIPTWLKDLHSFHPNMYSHLSWRGSPLIPF
jgi:hypothetical protein